MRLLALLLSAFLVLIQYPLWYGKGGWLRVWELEGELAEQRELNDQRRLRNAALLAEVKDLKSGTDAVEEIARMRLGMVKPGEIFVHMNEPQSAEASVGSVARSPTGSPAQASLKPGIQRAVPVSAGSTSPVVAVAR
jgi:cell division protein FtsB